MHAKFTRSQNFLDLTSKDGIKISKLILILFKAINHSNMALGSIMWLLECWKAFWIWCEDIFDPTITNIQRNSKITEETILISWRK